MAYATKYLFKFQSANGTTREIRVLKDGYSGSVLQRALGRAPILKKQKNGTVFGTSLEFYAECKVDGEFAEFYTTDPKAYKVQLYAGNDKLWEGFVTPELYAEPDIAPPYDVQVIATDGVGELKLYDFAAQGSKTLRQMFTYLLGYTGVGTDVYLISSMKAGSSGAGALLEKTINLDYMVGKNCYEVLTYLLDTLHATITWWKGAWIVARETNVTFQNGKVKYFNTAGNAAQLAGSVVTLGKMYSNDAWPVGQLTQKVDPAKKSVTVQAPWHPVTCLVNSDMDSDTGWTKTNNAAYNSSKKAYSLPDNAPSTNVATIAQNVAMGGIRVPMSFSGKFCATAAPTTGAIYGGIAGIGIKYVTSGSVSYYLAQDSEGNPQWVQGTLTGNTDFQIRLSSVDTDEINAETLEFEIPALAVGSSFPAGTLTFEIVGRAALVFNAYLDVTLPKGYQDRLHLDNGARGEGDTVEIAIGRETSDIDYYKAFLQGILLDSGSLITSFKDDALTTATDFLSYISRDYARSFALPRIIRTGKVGLESAVTFPPLVFTKGAIDYWVETWGWDMYEDELDISARSLPTATITVESEVISEATGTTSSSQSSGGSSSSIQPGGANYFELSGSDVQLKSAYEKLILPVLQVTGNATIGGTLGVTGAATLSSTLAVTGPATLSGGISLGGTYNSQDSKLVWDATNNAWHLIGNFYADGFVSAGGISSGGGSAGIDLQAMWASLQNNDNADTSTTAKIHNYHLPACGTGLSYTLDANGMATNLNLNLSSSLVTSALGYTPVNPSSLGTMAYASTGDYVNKSSNENVGGSKTFTSESGIIFQRSGGQNAYNEGIRFNLCGPSNWAGFTIGGTQTSGTGQGIWAFLVNSSDFSLGHNGSNLASIGLNFSASGSLNFKTTSFTNNNHTIWHAGNDGSGSGLDADLLDGQHGSYYAPAVSGGYLPLSAGSGKPLTDILYINSRPGIEIRNMSNTNGETGLRVASSDTNGNVNVKGYFGWLSAYGTYLFNANSGYYLGINDSGYPHFNGNTLLHAANYTSYVYDKTTSDGRYLRADTDNSYGYRITFSSSNDGIQVGGIRGYFTNQLIHLYERVNIGYPSGWGGQSAPTYGLSTYGGCWLATDQGSVGIGTTSPSRTLDVVGDGIALNSTATCGMYMVSSHGESSISFQPNSTNIRSVIGAWNPVTAGTTNGCLFVWNTTIGTHLVIDSGTGNVGVGYINPGYKVTVDGSGYFNGNLFAVGTIVNYGRQHLNGIAVDNGWSYIRLENTYGGTTHNLWDIGTNGAGETIIGSANAFEIRDGLDSYYGISIRHATSSYGRLVVTSPAGESSIGYWSTTHNPTSGYPVWTVGYKGGGSSDNYAFGWYYATSGWKMSLDAYGNLVAVGAVTAGSASDARFKDNVRTMTDAKDVIMSLHPVRFTWNKLARSKSEQYIGDDLGFIAQEVQPLVPQAVSSIYEEYLRVDSTKFIAPLVSVAQDHELRIRELEAKCARLEAENNELKRLNAN